MVNKRRKDQEAHTTKTGSKNILLHIKKIHRLHNVRPLHRNRLKMSRFSLLFQLYFLLLLVINLLLCLNLLLAITIPEHCIIIYYIF